MIITFQKNCYEGSLNYHGELMCVDEAMLLISEDEFKFFEEIPFEEDDNISKATVYQEETINNTNEPHSNKVSAAFSDGMIHCIKEDCQAVNGSLCFYKEGAVFLWNEDEYFIESVDDYYKVINSIKVLNSFKK